jgi:hypothetical protein
MSQQARIATAAHVLPLLRANHRMEAAQSLCRRGRIERVQTKRYNLLGPNVKCIRLCLLKQLTFPAEQVRQNRCSVRQVDFNPRPGMLTEAFGQPQLDLRAVATQNLHYQIV